MAPTDEIHDDGIESVVLSSHAIRDRVQQMADEMAGMYKGILQKKQSVILICILKGSTIFTADLCRGFAKHDIPIHLEFMSISTYGSGTESSGTVRVLLDLKRDIKGQHVVVVEDIIDSGTTLKYLQELLRSRQPASLRTCVLLNKPSRRIHHEATVDWVGFDIPDVFVVGYGMDYAESRRHLPYIGQLRASVYERKLAKL